MQHSQHARQWDGAQSGQIQGVAIRLRWILGDKGLHRGFVIWMQSLQNGLSCFFTWIFTVSKAYASGVADEGVKRVQIAPARQGCSLAEVVFFAVALAKIFNVKQANVRQAIAPDVHAKTHSGGYVRHGTGVDLRAQCVDLGSAVVGWQCVVTAKLRVAANGGVVRERRDSGDIGTAVGGVV